MLTSPPLNSQTQIYASGVGLGASKGVEVGKYEPGYTGYVHKAQDAVSGPHSPLLVTWWFGLCWELLGYFVLIGRAAC